MDVLSDDRLWISVSDYAKYAPFGTKTGLAESSKTSSSGVQIGPQLPSSSNQTPVILTAPSYPLRIVPAVGDLVDARTPNGIWYQVDVIFVNYHLYGG